MNEDMTEALQRDAWRANAKAAEDRLESAMARITELEGALHKILVFIVTASPGFMRGGTSEAIDVVVRDMLTRKN